MGLDLQLGLVLVDLDGKHKMVVQAHLLHVRKRCPTNKERSRKRKRKVKRRITRAERGKEK